MLPETLTQTTDKAITWIKIVTWNLAMYHAPEHLTPISQKLFIKRLSDVYAESTVSTNEYCRLNISVNLHQ